MRATLRNAMQQMDILLSQCILSAIREQNSLNIFLFHALFQTKEEVARGLADPQQQVTVDMFRRFVVYYKSKGYIFVSPADVLQGLDPKERYIMITFDDGYYNNLRALPVLEEFNVPALFFISACHVQKGKAFWWDVAHREGIKAGMTNAAIAGEKAYLLTLTDDAIDKYLMDKYGAGCLTPVSDTDRPFTPEELKCFAQHPLVHIGNHTCDHAVLTKYTEAGIREQIGKAQVLLEEMAGYRPESIAYPCGEYNEKVLQVCQQEGIKLGITVQQAKNFCPQLYEPTNLLTLKRFTIWGTNNLIGQCDFYRSDYHLLDKMKAALNRIKATIPNYRNITAAKS